MTVFHRVTEGKLGSHDGCTIEDEVSQEFLDRIPGGLFRYRADCVWQSNSRQFGMQEFDTLTANMPTITNGYSCLASVTTRKAGKAYDQHVQSTFY